MFVGRGRPASWVKPISGAGDALVDLSAGYKSQNVLKPASYAQYHGRSTTRAHCPPNPLASEEKACWIDILRSSEFVCYPFKSKGSKFLAADGADR